MKYYIIAGEPSGDLHGANLIKGILESDPDAEIRFWGGDLMQEASGVRGTLVRHYRDESVMGFIEVLMKLRKIKRSMDFCKRDIAEFAPDALILIDYPGFNLRMAKFAKSIGILTLYYIAPKVWAWKEGRVKKIKADVDKLFVIFPFEVEYFKNFGIDAYFGGNPLVDSLEDNRAQGEGEDFRTQNNIPTDKEIVALVAGSRRHEIQHNLPVMLEVAKEREDLHFVITGVEWLDRGLYESIIGEQGNVTLLINQTTPTLRNSSAALVTSGTATLETALLEVPQVVCFKGPRLTMWIASKLVKIRWISLVNIVMDRTVVTELIQKNFTKQAALKELEAVLKGGLQHDRIVEDYRELASKIGGAGASKRVATEMVREIKERKV